MELPLRIYGGEKVARDECYFKINHSMRHFYNSLIRNK